MSSFVHAPIAVDMFMGGRSNGPLIAADIAGDVGVTVVDVIRPVPDAGGFVGAIGVGAGVPVGSFVHAPIAVSVLMGGRSNGPLIAADIAGDVGVTVVDVIRPVFDTGGFVGAIWVGAGAPVDGFIRAPIAVGMGVGRDAGIAAGVASGVCVVGVDVVFPVLDTGYFFGAIGVGAGVPVGCFVFAPIAVSMGMGRGAGIAAGVASGVGVVGVDVVFPVLDTGCFFGAIRVGTGVPVRGFVRAPIAVGMGVGKGAGIAADVAGGVGIAVVDVEIRQFALLGVGAGFVCADTRMAGFAVGGPGAVGVGMGGVRGDGAFIAADVAGGIGVAVVDVGCAVHFRLVWAVLGGADAIVMLGVIFPAVKGVGMAQYGGAFMAADVAVVVAVMVIDMAGFILNAAGFVRAVRVDTFMPVAIYIPAPIAVDMAAGMVRGDGTDIAADIAGGIRVIVVNVRRCIKDPPCFLRAAGVGTFAPVVYAVPAPLAVVVNMGRGDGAVVATDITDVAVEGVAGLLGLGGAAGLGAELPVAGTIVVPAAIGVIGMPVAAVGAVAVGVEGMGLFIFPGGGGVGAVGVGAVAPVAGLIPAVEAFGVGVVTNGAGKAAGDAGRAGFAAVIVFGVFGNKIAIT